MSDISIQYMNILITSDGIFNNGGYSTLGQKIYNIIKI